MVNLYIDVCIPKQKHRDKIILSQCQCRFRYKPEGKDPNLR